MHYSYLTGNFESHDFKQHTVATIEEALEAAHEAVKTYGRAGSIERRQSAVTGTVATLGANGVTFATALATKHETEAMQAHNDRVIAALHAKPKEWGLESERV